MKVRFVGSGDAFGCGGRFTTCILVEDSLGRLTLDFGPASMVALRRQEVEPSSLGGVIITHLHGDHFGGLPMFILEQQLVSKRRSPLTLAGPPGFAGQLERLCEVMYPGMWNRERPYDLRVIEVEPGEPVEFLGRRLATRKVAHRTGAFPATGVRLENDGRAVAYSGDTEWTDALIDLARGTDLFICECYYHSTAVPHHMTWERLSANRHRLETRRLMLTHLSDEMLGRLDEVDCEAACDGKEVVLAG